MLGPLLAMQMTYLDLSRNALSGPAFPATWLQPGAMPSLQLLLISDNAGLTGSLPATLPWPVIAIL